MTIVTVTLAKELTGERLQPYDPNSQSVLVMASFKCTACYQTRPASGSGAPQASNDKLNAGTETAFRR